MNTLAQKPIIKRSELNVVSTKNTPMLPIKQNASIVKKITIHGLQLIMNVSLYFPITFVWLTGAFALSGHFSMTYPFEPDAVDYPHLRDLLPYRDYDSDHQLFINQHSLGFLLEAQPLIGANEKLVESLEELVKNNLPRDMPLQVILLSSQTVYEKLTIGLRDFSWQGSRADECNQITQGFYLDAARHQFANPQNLPLTLRDYHQFFAFCQPCKRVTESEIIKVREIRRNLLSALNASDIHADNASIERFLQMMREMINPDTERLKPYLAQWIEDKDINQQIVQTIPATGLSLAMWKLPDAMKKISRFPPVPCILI
ncbi:MAG: TraC family protein [Arsenophonus sp.]|nr:TraC family protein [Arsenophonus sp.]